MAKKELKLREITPRRIRPMDAGDVPEIPLLHDNLLSELRNHQGSEAHGETDSNTTYSTISNTSSSGVKTEHSSNEQSRPEERPNFPQPEKQHYETLPDQQLLKEKEEDGKRAVAPGKIPPDDRGDSGAELMNESGRGPRTKRRPQDLELPTFIRGKTRIIWDYLLKTASRNHDLTGQGMVLRVTRREIGDGARVGSLDTVDKAIAQLQGLGYIRVTHTQGYREGNVIKILDPGFTPSSEETAWKQIAEVLGRSSKLIAEKGLRLSSVELLQWSALADRARRLLNEQEDQGNLN